MFLGILGNWDALIVCVGRAWVYNFLGSRVLTFLGFGLRALNVYVGGWGT